MKPNNRNDGLLKKADNKIQELEKKYLDNRSEFSKEQKSRIKKRKKEYFEGVSVAEKTIEAERRLGAYGIEIYKSYLPFVYDSYIPVYSLDKGFKTENRLISFDITRWVVDPEEKNIEKLTNVYEVLANENCSIALIYKRTRTKTTVTLSVANLGEESTPDTVKDYAKRVQDAIYGNFPGAIIKSDDKGVCCSYGVPRCFEKSITYKNNTFGESDIIDHCDSVAVVSNIPSDKSEDFISQSIEKLLDGIIPKNNRESYSLLLLAQPNRNTDRQKERLCDLYTTLSPYASWQTSQSAGESDTDSMASTLGKHIGGSVGASTNVNAGIPGLGASAGVSASANFGVNFGKTANQSVTINKGESLTETYTNYAVKHALELVEEQVKRVDECSALGMWNFAAYALSEDANVANNVASMYLALTQGEQSHLFQSAINLWNGSRNPANTACIIESLKRLQHPRFLLDKLKYDKDESFLLYPTEIDLCSLISGKELTRALNFPRKSVAGFPVIECASFGRNVIKYDKEENGNIIPLGNIFHMNKEEPTPVNLDKQSLASHVFITGSTGSGKSNTVYHLLEELQKQKVHFLVIEPAKGEYKGVFGSDSNVNVYGTNPMLSDLLRLNPFSFTDGIHVLEHIDRLVEIFNACWPMYAAMPAVLKSAVEQAYTDCGWDMITSANLFGEKVYPTFSDVARNVKTIIDSSDYDNENKGAYKGSLLTRLQSLTTGINNVIFSCNESAEDKLFDENTIVDLSRVGSSETKSLIMGILVLKLQEYRMAKASGDNAALKHITVLEEAHNLLRRTSSEQSADSANLQGKSVEMIANAIAEMRTYGEGFIIADQAPGLMDMSVIRNTNTKVIMRLPDQGDRELIGKAANLNDAQISELAKLQRGVAAVYQNEWIQPVLCKIPKNKKKYSEYVYRYNAESIKREQPDSEQSVLDAILDENNLKYGNADSLMKLKSTIIRSGLASGIKSELLAYLNADDQNRFDLLRTLVYDFLSAAKAVEKSRDCSDIKAWTKSVVYHLNPSVETYTNEQINLVVSLIVYEQTIRDREYDDLLCRYAEVFKSEGGVY